MKLISNMPQINTVIFDMDGVIVDSEPIHLKIVYNIVKELGIQISKKDLRRYVGTSGIEMWTDLADRYNLDRSPQKITQTNHQRYAEYIKSMDNLPAVQGVGDCIEQFHQMEIPLVLASSSSMAQINLILQKLNLGSYFPLRISGADLPKSKPDPLIFQKAAEMAGTTPSQCLVIEDSFNGVTAAKAAGMVCIGYRNPNSGNQDLGNADFVIDDFLHLDPEHLFEKFL